MARKALYKHATQVNTSSYPDDGTSPVGSNEWNEAPDPQGMLGFTPATATITIASGVATVTDTITVVAAESGTSDTLDKLAITNTSQYDLIYLFADTGDTITLTNTSSPSADGQIRTVSDSNETLSSTVPTILIRKGNYWYGYGGGVVNAVSDIGDVTISSIGSGEILKWNGSAWINQTLAESGIAPAAGSSSITTVGTLGTLSVDNLTINSNKVEATNTNGDIELDSNGTGVIKVLGNTNDGAITLNCTANSHGQTIKSQPHSASATNTMLLPLGANSTLVSLVSADTLTNKTLTSPVINVGSDADGDMYYRASGAYVRLAKGTAGQALKMNSGATAPEWAASGGGAHTTQDWTVQSSAPSNPSSGTGVMYVKTIDTNNEGLFIKMKKNGSIVEVQVG